MLLLTADRISMAAALRGVAGAAWLCIVAGCSAPGDVDMLEAQLRRQEDLLRNCQSQLNDANGELERAEREIELLRGQLSGSPAGSRLPEYAHSLARVDSINVDAWSTGLIDQDAFPGADHLLLVLCPRDAAGEVVQVSGELKIEAFDPARPPDVQTIGHWDFSAQQTDGFWQTGLMSTGFYVHVPLPEPPSGNELQIRASISLPDGRSLMATHSIPVQSSDGVETTLPLLDQSDSVSTDPVSESDAELLPVTSRDVLVPDPPSGQPFVDNDAASAGYTSDPLEEADTGDEEARHPDFNRHRPPPTSDNWTVDGIPAWR